MLGEWSDISRSIVGNDKLRAVGVGLGLQKCLHMDPGMADPSTNMVATMIEALLGAVYLDGGNDALVAVVAKLELGHELL
jgi:ribonuclease III